MSVDIRVPSLGDSATEATIGKWFKQPGEAVNQDEPIVELETDKVTIEVNAPASGVLAEITAKDGETVAPGGLLGQITAGAGAAAAPAAAAPAAAPAPAPKAAPAAAMPPAPAAAKIAADNNISTDAIAGSGKRGQVLKGDVLAAVAAAHGAPTYVYSAARIVDNYRRLADAFSRAAGSPVALHYAVKANANAAILRLLRECVAESGKGRDADEHTQARLRELLQFFEPKQEKRKTERRTPSDCFNWQFMPAVFWLLLFWH